MPYSLFLSKNNILSRFLRAVFYYFVIILAFKSGTLRILAISQQEEEQVKWDSED